MAARKWTPSRIPVVRHHEDDELRNEVRGFLRQLGADHPATLAFEGGAPTLEAQRLIDDGALVALITAAYNRWRDREVASRPRYFNPYV